MHTAKLGDRVRIQYCRLPQRAAEPGGPNDQKTLEFTVGSRDVFPSLSVGVIGMAPGDRRQFTLQPHEAYGDIKPKLVRQIPRSKFPERILLKVGKRLTAGRGIAGRRRRVTIVAIKPDTITVDGNHPLAGQVIQLEVSLLTLDSSANANEQKPQFDLGGQG